MSPNSDSSFQSPTYLHKLSKAIEFAVSEWLLMFLLFIDAFFAYLIAKFAAYCKLKNPCVLCSRYDHVIAKNKTGVYWNSICNHHKSEISSLVLCRVCEICESCLLSFTAKTKNKFNDENLRLLVEKTGSRDSLEDKTRDSSGSRICFCCNEKYVSRDYAKNLLSASSIRSNDAYESLLTNGEHAKNEKSIFVDEFRSLQIEKNQIVHESEFGYQKVEVDSDKELELPVSDNGSVRALVSKVDLKSDSQFENSENHSDPAVVATRDIGELKWRNDANKEDESQISELISFDEVPSSKNAKTSANEFIETTDTPRTDELIKDPVTESEPSATTNGHQIPNYLDLGDAYKLAISTKARQLSGRFLDQKSFKDSSTRVTEDLKMLKSHISNDILISPKLSFNSDELTSMHFLQTRISLDRNESNLSLDGSVVSEIEGESIVDRLKRQVELDKKVMSVLYKELEEERNASAVATNQAMAMITRLQEEKAALYTEALQSLRMMEEQAEYDNEALQKANDVIEEKDKQIQELEELLRNTSEDVRE